MQEQESSGQSICLFEKASKSICFVTLAKAGKKMPIYEYQCPNCGRVFEEWVKSSEAHKEEPCPDCGTSSPRIISRTSFVLKGDGWYVSDYGYRKGITEDGGKSADVPAKAQPVAPAPQGEKSVAKAAKKMPPAKKDSAAAPKAASTVKTPPKSAEKA